MVSDNHEKLVKPIFTNIYKESLKKLAKFYNLYISCKSICRNCWPKSKYRILILYFLKRDEITRQHSLLCTYMKKLLTWIKVKKMWSWDKDWSNAHSYFFWDHVVVCPTVYSTVLCACNAMHACMKTAFTFGKQCVCMGHWQCYTITMYYW